MKYISRFLVLDTHEDMQVVGSAWSMDVARARAKAYAQLTPDCQVSIVVRTFYEDGRRRSELAGVPDSVRWEDGFQARFNELAEIKPWLVREEGEPREG